MRKLCGIMIVISIAWIANTAMAQSSVSDSLTVEQAIALTIRNHPAISQAQYGMAATAASIDIERSDLYPDISLQGRYARVGPISSFALPGQSPIELAPRNNYNVYLDLKQTLYDFGRTREAVRLAELTSQNAGDNVDLVSYNLAYRTMEVFEDLLILHQQLTVLDEQLQTLKQHLEMSIRKMEAGTATDFDTLTIRVKIAVVSSDHINAEHALETQEILLRRLTGLPPDTPIHPSGAFATDAMALRTDSLLAAADEQRPELVISRDMEAKNECNFHLQSLSDMPELSLNLTTGFKNGFEPDMNTWRGNYVAGLELEVPVFNGHRTKYLKAEASANLNAARVQSADIRQQVHAEVMQALAGVDASRKKITSTETQVQQAEKACSRARVRYDAGVITNLDLLDAEMTLSQTKLIRIRAFYDYSVSLNALDKATGKKIW